MIKLILLFLSSCLFCHANAQTVSERETARIIGVLASDSLKGRGNGQPGLLKAAAFIGKEFREIGLTPLTGHPGYYFPFWPSKKRVRKKDTLSWNIETATAGALYNVVAMLPGKSKANEVVIFSAHYDHMGVLKSKRNGKDSIMNGANDNASGTTALMMLAKYFAEKNDNERTLLFCAFAGEELGLEGSKNFIQYIKTDQAVANINLEMIGIPQFGKRTVFITGEDKTQLGHLLKVNLQRSGLSIVPEPSPEFKNLFARSDNFNFFLENIPAHTIMASDDNDECYHSLCDEISRIDTVNLTDIIQAIAGAMEGVISGNEIIR